MAKQDRKTVKMLRARYAAFLLGGNKAEASCKLDAIMRLQAQYRWDKSFARLNRVTQQETK